LKASGVGAIPPQSPIVEGGGGVEMVNLDMEEIKFYTAKAPGNYGFGSVRDIIEPWIHYESYVSLMVNYEPRWCEECFKKWQENQYYETSFFLEFRDERGEEKRLALGHLTNHILVILVGERDGKKYIITQDNHTRSGDGHLYVIQYTSEDEVWEYSKKLAAISNSPEGEMVQLSIIEYPYTLCGKDIRSDSMELVLYYCGNMRSNMTHMYELLHFATLPFPLFCALKRVGEVVRIGYRERYWREWERYRYGDIREPSWEEAPHIDIRFIRKIFVGTDGQCFSIRCGSCYPEVDLWRKWADTELYYEGVVLTPDVLRYGRELMDAMKVIKAIGR